MRVVYDTSVLATILSRRNMIFKLQLNVSNNRVSLVTSLFIINELEKVLFTKFNLTKQGAKSRSRLLARVSEIVQPNNIDKVSRDENDDYILATALTGHANYIVSLDKDLLILKVYRGIPIVTPTEFDRILSKTE